MSGKRIGALSAKVFVALLLCASLSVGAFAQGEQPEATPEPAPLSCCELAAAAQSASVRPSESAQEAATPEPEESQNQSDAQTPPENKAELQRAIVGYYGGTCEAPIYVAYELGLFEQVGLDVELLKITEDTAILVATNKLDALMATPSLFKGMEQGLDIKLTDGIHTGCIQGAAPAGSGIDTVENLEGKTVGVESIGGIPMIEISSQMLRKGLDPKKVNWVVYPGPQLQLAMENGAIDCFATWDPYPEMALEKGHHIFFSNTHDEGLRDTLCCFLGINGGTVRDRPDVARKITQAFALAGDVITKDPQMVAQMAIDKQYTAGSVELMASLLGQYQWIHGDEENARRSVREIYGMLEENGVLDAGADVEKLSENALTYLGD